MSRAWVSCGTTLSSPNIHEIGILEGSEHRKVFKEIMAESFPNMRKLETHRSKNLSEPQAPRYIIMDFLMTNDKEKNLKSSQRGKKGQVTYKGTKIRMTANFLQDIMQARQQWINIC